MNKVRVHKDNDAVNRFVTVTVNYRVCSLLIRNFTSSIQPESQCDEQTFSQTLFSSGRDISFMTDLSTLLSFSSRWDVYCLDYKNASNVAMVLVRCYFI